MVQNIFFFTQNSSISDALQCFMNGLDTAEDECEDNKRQIPLTYSTLERLIEERTKLGQVSILKHFKKLW